MVQIRINTGCFYYWDIQLQELVDRFGKYLDGFEFTLDNDDVLNFKGLNLPDNLTCNSIHISTYQMRFTAFDKLREVMKQLNVSQVIIHPYDIEGFGQVPDDINFLIENMDIRNKNFKKISEVLRLVDSKKNFGFNFDVCHMEEIEQGSTDREIESFQDRIDAMHVSVPSNKNYNIDTPHFLCFNSEFPLPKKLPLNVPWTIEGVVPVNDDEALRKEIEFLRNYSK